MALLNINHFNNNQDLLKKFYQGGGTKPGPPCFVATPHVKIYI